MGLGYCSNTVFVSTLINDFILYAPFYSEVSEHHLVVGAMYNKAIAQGLPIFFIWSKCSQKNVHNLLISLSMFCLPDKSSMKGLAIEFKLAFLYY